MSLTARRLPRPVDWFGKTAGTGLFAVGSQGLENALVAHWQATGLLDKPRQEFRAAPTERIVCVSGSCSPVTAGQIAFAEQNGFAGIRLDAARAVDRREWEQELGRAEDQALAAIGAGRDPLVFTANGPDDPALACVASAVEASGQPAGEINDRIGSGLGRILDRVMRHAQLTRAVIAGGDTSGHATRELGIYALTAVAPIAPGSPLCRAYSDDPCPCPTRNRTQGWADRSARLFLRCEARRSPSQTLNEERTR